MILFTAGRAFWISAPLREYRLFDGMREEIVTPQLFLAKDENIFKIFLFFQLLWW